MFFFVSETLAADESRLCVSEKQISHVSQCGRHCDDSSELLVDEAGVSARGCQPFPCWPSLGGFLKGTFTLFISKHLQVILQEKKKLITSSASEVSSLERPTQHWVVKTAHLTAFLD